VEPGTERTFIDDLDSDPAISTEDLVVVSPGTLKGVLSTDECIGSCSAVRTGVFQLDGRFTEDGRMVQVIVAPDRENIRAMIADLEAHGHTVSLLHLSSLQWEELLTARQENLLLTALERGFFDDPKGTSLRDLADYLGISISTVSEMLRKATYKVMSAYFTAKS